MIRFWDLDKMHVFEWLVAQFDMTVDNEGCVSDLEDKIIEMHVNHEAKALFKNKNLAEC